MKEPKKETITMRVTETMLNDLKSIANELNVSQSECLKELMKHYREHKPAWISIKDKLPPVDELVLGIIWDDLNEQYEVLVMYLEFYEFGGSFVLRDTEYNDITRITKAWSYIPSYDDQKLFDKE